MKKLLGLLLLWVGTANAQFVPGQLLTAAELNTQFSLYAPLAGAVFSGPVAGTTFSGAFSGPHNGSVGATTPTTGAFTTLAASGTVSGVGFSNYLASPPGIGGTVPAAGAFTTLSSSGVASLGTGSTIAASPTLGDVSGKIATTFFVATTLASPPAIGGTTAAAGSFTTLAASSTITPSQTAGIVGTTTNNNANAGSVGEYISSSASAVSLTTSTPTNITSISLTAGDWDVSGAVAFVNPGTSSVSSMIAGISTTSGAFGALVSGFGQASVQVPATTGLSGSTVAPYTTRISIASTTTVYLIGQCNFTISTFTANGYIRARRIR
jgi:hypothetical protein